MTQMLRYGGNRYGLRVTRLRFLRGVAVMYHGCRSDWPGGTPDCRMGRVESLRAALSWAWKWR